MSPISTRRSEDRRPNILFLMSDEHRADVAGFGGNRVVRTPVLDQLAETGVVFDNAYTPSPICVPARQCLMSGQLPKTCRCEGWLDLAPNHMTFARRLAEYAYSTVASGKLNHLGNDQMQGWTQRLAGDISVSGASLTHRQEQEFARYARSWNELKWSDSKEVRRAGIGQARNATEDSYAVQGAINYIEDTFASPYYDRERGKQPLLLKVSLNQPHYPYITRHDRFTYYLNRVTPYGVAPDLEPPFPHPFLSQRQVCPGEDATERELRRATAAYYGMVETVDEQFGRVLDALRHVGQDPDEWVIVYTSDHGEMLGQHGIWEKQKFFEASVRVPLIIRWPHHVAPRVVHQNVNLCDLFATLCKLAAVPTPAGLDSRSLVGLMQGDTEGWPDETVSQFRTTNLMIKQGALKYQWYGPDMPEVLFDLAHNPEETVNYLNHPDYAAVLETFRQRRAALGHGPDALPYVNAGYSSGTSAGISAGNSA